MTPLARGALVAAAQVALIGAVGGKLLYDRATLPRAWVATAGVDPDLPIRGRYVALNLVLPLAPESVAPGAEVACGRIELRDGRPVALLDRDADARDAGPARSTTCFRQRRLEPGEPWVLIEPVAFFLPEDAPDPTRDARPGELWVEVTLPARGAPRPIRLGLERTGVIEPLR